MKDVTELLEATDQECNERRNILIANGIIIPTNKSDIIKINGEEIVSTRKSVLNKRKQLIKQGVINPRLCNIIHEKNIVVENNDDGEYNPKKISNDDEYLRRRSVYFRMLQEIIFARIDLRLILGKKNSNDPEWIF